MIKQIGIQWQLPKLAFQCLEQISVNAKMSCQKFAACRPNDFFYDPLFIVSSKKDYYKAGYFAKIYSAKYAVCPVFSSMFSDMPNYPRLRYLMRRGTTIPPYIEPQSSHMMNASRQEEENEVNGANRYKYFSMSISTMELAKDVIVTTRKTESPEVQKEKYRTKDTQTMFRESSAQTHPWEPEYKVVDGSDPEVLKLDFLKWGAGLPAGMHEIRLIERARMKRAWEASLPPCTDAKNLEKRKEIIEAMERDEWAFREQEIQDIQDLRLELLEQMLSELHEKSACRTEKKMKLFCDRKEKEKTEKLEKVKAKTIRELRKLKMKHEGYTGKYRPVNIVEEFADPTSELYAPLMRHGSHPKRWHLKLDPKERKYKTSYSGVENMDTLPSWLHKATEMKDCICIKLPGTRLCMRETKWTTPVLKHLYEELKALRQMNKLQICNLKVRIPKPLTPPVTPEVDCEDEDEVEGVIATIRLQSILRGRASQTLIYSGRDRCRKLIDELKTTHALLQDEKNKQFDRRCEVKNQQREQELCLKNAAKLHEILSRLQGTIVGTLLDFLNKELHKLMEERKTHAMCLMAERERHKREAAEAGRRQKEIRRRKEHDEMFKQIVKVHQETVDMYLQDIITEGLEFASEQQAKEFVLMKATEIEEEIKKPIEGHEEHEEYVANLVHHFVLPEVEKQLIRQRNKEKQRKHLKITHEAIYKRIEHLPKPKPGEGASVQYLPPTKHQMELLPPSPATETQKTEDDKMSLTEMTDVETVETESLGGTLKSFSAGSRQSTEEKRSTFPILKLSPSLMKESLRIAKRRSQQKKPSLVPEESEQEIIMPERQISAEDFGVAYKKQKDKDRKSGEPVSEEPEQEQEVTKKALVFEQDIDEIPRYGSLTRVLKPTSRNSSEVGKKSTK